MNRFQSLIWITIVILSFCKGYSSEQLYLVAEAVSLPNSNCNDLYHSNTYIDKTVEGLNSKVIPPSSKNVFHFFSHGKIGQLLIEEEWRNPSQIVAWIRKKRLLIEGTHLNIYGCNFGQGEKGQAAVRYLENALGVSVAASNDVTGIDGDWDLEVGNGQSGIQLPYYKKNLQSCNCEEYVYINDPGATGPVHKFKIEPDSTFTEIFSDNTTMTPFISGGQVLLPHGVDADCFGNLYVGNIDRGASATRGIDKFNCLGVLEQANVIPNDEDAGNMNGPGGSSLPPGPVGGQTNFFIVGDKMYINSWVQDDIDGPQITVYDVCSGERLGEYINCDPSTGTTSITGNHWGMYVNETTMTAFYNTNSGIVVYDLTQPFGCQDSVIIKQGALNTNNRGITQLPDGSLVTRHDDHIFKYALDGTLLAGPVDMSTIVADQGLDEGGSRAYGLVSTEDGRIYVVSPGRECASLYDENLNYIKAAFVVPGGASGSAKAVAIVKECCPVNPMTTIDTIICVPSNSEPLFLKDFFLCDGSICISGDPEMATGSDNLSFDPCSGKIDLIDPEQYACGTFTLSNGSNGDANQCNAFTVTINLEIGIEPEAKVFAIQPSCVDGVSQNDGYLQISEMTLGDRFNWSMGSTYTGDGNYNNAIIPTGFPYQFATGQSNPSGSQDYTIRVFSEDSTCGGNHCYTDYTVTMNEQDCMVGCACEEYIYLNETTGGLIHKYQVQNDGSLIEVLVGGNPWYPGTGTSELPSPHGLATDLNGFLYIAERYNPGQDIRKLTCDGEILPESEFAVPSGNLAANLASIGNTIYTNTGLSYDVCTEESQGTVCLDGLSSNDEKWGFWYDENTGYFYSTSSDGTNGNLYRYTSSDWGSGTCVAPFMTHADIFAIYQDSVAGTLTTSNSWTRGITTDDSGNIYLTLWVGGRPSNFNGAVIKFSPDGNTVLAHTAIDDIEGNSGWYWATSPVYIADQDILYVSTQSLSESCVYAFAASDLTPLFEAVAPSGDSGQGQSGFGVAKAMATNSECCPTNNNINIDTTLCSAAIGDTIFLQQLINCSGTICEGIWQEGISNTGLAYNSCNNSVTITSLTGCGSLTLESDGTGNNPQCGAFKITVNIQVGTTPEAKVFAIQPSCVDGVSQSDGYLQISEITSGVKFNWSVGSTYTGDPDFANAIDTTGLSFPYQFATGQSNPSGSQDYTIRVFAAPTACGNGCGYVDYTVTMNEQDCTVGCNCEEYIYMNEPSAQAAGITGNNTLKFQIHPDGSVTELLSPSGGHWQEGLTFSPHGLGSDVNGFLYIGNAEHVDNPTAGTIPNDARYPLSGVDKYDCRGNLLEEDFIPPALGDGMTGSSGLQTNIYSIGNTLYMNGWRGTGYNDAVIFAYDICTRELIGTYTVCDMTSSYRESWDFHIDEANNRIIINNYQSNGIAIGDLDMHLNGPCMPIELGTSAGHRRGITMDPTGNIYVRDANWLYKYDTNYNLEYSVNLTIDGGSNAWGLVYSETTGYLYLSGNDADCISVYDPTDGSYVMQGFPNPADSPVNKSINISTECCPTNNNITIDTILCEASINDTIFLQDLIDCSGTICEGLWQEGTSNVGLTYNSCNNFITIQSLDACGSFTLGSDGTGSTPQCGAFKIEVNISVNVVTASIVAADQTVCVGGDPEAFTVTTPAVGGTLSYQWQSSSTDCATGFSNIDGAISASYDPPSGLTDTMYYRVLVTSLNAGCSTGRCVDTSNCITVNAVPCDWGDLPDAGSGTAQGDYETNAVNNGPNHMIIDGLHLGASIDGETDGQASTDALGDGVDENGIQLPNSLDAVAGGTLQIPFSALNTTGNTAYVEMWIDWNGDGDFNDPNEWVVDIDDSAGFPSQLNIPVPQGIDQDQNIGVRLRLSNTDDMTPYGAVDSGEVEDYLLSINCKTNICLPTTVTIKKN